MPDTNPTPVDLDRLTKVVDLTEAGGLPEGDEIAAYVAIMQTIVPALIAELRSARAAIPGPDSERIRELQAEVAELRRRLAASQSSPEWTMIRCPTCGQIAPPHSHQNFVMP